MARQRRAKPTTKWGVMKRGLADMATSDPNGYTDPARVIGYLFPVISGLVFLVMIVWSSFKNGKFDGIDFAAGVTSISAAIGVASWGVAKKNGTEGPPPERQEPFIPQGPNGPPQ